MACLWEVEQAPGLTAVIVAENHDAMIKELRRIGFKSILTEEAQTRCVIDVMYCVSSNGKEYYATEYAPRKPRLYPVQDLPVIDEWEKLEKGGEQ